MPWKNGSGVTTELAICPPEAKFSDNNFLWRLSSAEIKSKNTFSQFPGYDRILFVVKGGGLRLIEPHAQKQIDLQPLIPFFFKGETPIECNIIKDQVIDLGIIFNREKVKVEAKVYSLTANPNLQTIFFDHDNAINSTNILVCIEGQCFIEKQLVGSMDSIEITNTHQIKLKTSEACTFIGFTIVEQRESSPPPWQ